MKELTDKQKIDLIQIIYHEIKTPLTVIKGGISLVKESRERAQPMQNILEICERNINTISWLFNDLSDLVRGEKLKINPSEYKITSAIGETYNSLGGIVKGITLTLDKTKELKVYADSGRVEQMLTNLFTNAIKYGRKKKDIKVKIEEGIHPQTNSHVVYVSITNDGSFKGDIKKAFSMYYTTGGTGLGLYITRELLRSHGCDISLKSNQKTTTFKFYLPATEEAYKALIENIKN